MNWIKCESKKARLLKGHGGGTEEDRGGRGGCDGRCDNVFTVSTLRRFKCAFKKRIIKKKCILTLAKLAFWKTTKLSQCSSCCFLYSNM